MKKIIIALLLLTLFSGNVVAAAASANEGYAFSKERKKFSQDKLNKLLENDMIYVEDQKKYIVAGRSYFKQTLEETNYVYYGAVKDGRPNGQGILYVARNKFSSDYYPKYMGEFKDGSFNGYGVLYYTQYGMPEGWTDQVYLRMKQYEGYFHKGKFSGKGNYATDNQIKNQIKLSLAGYLKSNKASITSFMKSYEAAKSPLAPHRFPEFEFSFNYTGNFAKGKLNGKGKQYSADNKLMYDGSFSDDTYNGKGKLYYGSGKLKYSGSFKSSKFHGKGTLYNEDGSVKYKGKWHSGDIK